MKKLLFVISQFYKGGAETSLLNLLKNLDKSRYEIDLIVMNQKPAKNAVSLIEQLPKEVYVLNAYQADQHLSLSDKLRAKLLLSLENRSMNPLSALLYVREREYDWAFHVGEWWSPRFVADCVRAKFKCAWLHTDISEADYFDSEGFFHYDDSFSYYLFVSQNSLRSSLREYPFISAKSRVLYNICDVVAIREAAEKPIEEDYFDLDLPVVLTLANVRKEKNHMRALEAMSILKDRGVDFLWLNVGSTSDTDRCQALMNRAEEFGLGDRFILTGSRSNPYPYINRADVVAVLSDYESWSMVITEAKILGKPIVSTKTSGALEQIEDRKNGLLADFDKNDIADKLEELLTSNDLRDSFSRNLKCFDNKDEILCAFDTLTDENTMPREKELLYIIDDINYLSGAHGATKLLIRKLLEKGIAITIFSNTVPKVSIRNELAGVHFLSWGNFPENSLFHRRLLDCLSDPHLSDMAKRLKREMTYRSKILRDPTVFEKMVLPNIAKLFSGYRTVCVMSEGSGFRKYVAKADSERKVQWIHTDYCDWRTLNDWTISITADDGELYKAFDKIVVLTPGIQKKMANLYPHLSSKIAVSRNILPVEKIIEKGMSNNEKDYRPLSFITVSRIDHNKGFDRLLRVLTKLYKDGYRFHWTFVGDGNDLNQISNSFALSPIKDCVKFTGSMDNPMPYIKASDVFALLSYYEGLPNTIFEALILGTPVLATDVGGIKTQIRDGETGWLVESDEREIYQKLEYIMSHTEEVAAFRENLKDYQYDNDTVLENMERILFSESITESTTV